MNIVDGEDRDGNSLGCECAGIIRKIGSNVEHLKVGDRVMVVDGHCFATNMITFSRMCTKIPDSLSFEDAATMPCVYSTVIRLLMEIGRLEANQVSGMFEVGYLLLTFLLDGSDTLCCRRCRHCRNSDIEDDWSGSKNISI